MESSSTQARILRLVQTNGMMERSALGLQSRSYDPNNWEEVLDGLVGRGLITEDSTIRVGAGSYRQQKRAVIVYTMADPRDTAHPEEFPVFKEMTAEAIQEFVLQFPLPATDIAS